MNTLDYMFSHYLSNVNYEKVNSTYAEAIIASLVVIFYLHYKLKHWAWQGIPNDAASIVNRFRSPFHIADNESYKKYGTVVGIYEGLRPALMVGDLCMIRQLLIKDFHKFPNHRFDLDGGDEVGTNFMFALKHSAWKRIRSIVSPSLTTEKIRQMQDLIKESLDFLVHNMEVMSINGYPVDMKKYFGAFAMDVISSCAFGTKVNSLQNPDNDIVKNAKKIFGGSIPTSGMISFLFPSLAKSIKIPAFDQTALLALKQVITSIIVERKAKPELRRNDFIQLLIDSGDDIEDCLSPNEIVDQGILFMIAGHETTTAALSSAAYCLATNSVCQEKLLEEIDSMLNIDAIDYDILENMPYLDAFICEVLRYLPPVPRIERKAAVDTVLGEVFVPKDTLIILPVYAIHHDADNFCEPEKFSPERFLCDGVRREDTYSFLPFGAGPRSCIGSVFALFEMKLCLVSILHKFRFSVCNETTVPPEFNIGQLVLSPKNVILNATKR